MAEQKQQMQASTNASQALVPRTPSLEQAGGLHRMVLRGHSAGISKILLTPNGTDVVTGNALLVMPEMPSTCQSPAQSKVPIPLHSVPVAVI